MGRMLMIFGILFGFYPNDRAYSYSMTTQDTFYRVSKTLRRLYLKEGTTGLLHRFDPSNLDDDTNEDHYFLTKAPTISPKEWISISLDAARGNKGMASGLLNARMGSFLCNCTAEHLKATTVISFMEAYDSLGSNVLTPDLVTLCLAYTAVRPYNMDTANRYLQRAIELYPHISGPSTLSSQGLCRTWEDLEYRYGIRLLHEQDEYLVLSKPSGMVCYHDSNNDSNRNTNYNPHLSLEECLSHHFKISLSTLNAQGKGMVHRIDRGTSGCVLVAKTNAAHATLLSQFFLRRVQKSYHAIVVTESANDCNFDVNQEGRISMPIHGRPSESHYIVQERLSSPRAVKLLIRTEQGRKHQVRIHCSKGWRAPILLDPLYGGRDIMSQFPSSCLQRFYSEHKFCLHASTLSIPEYDIHVEDPQPVWWQEVERELKHPK